MASLKVVKGTLAAYSESQKKNGVTIWDWWRINDERGRDVMLKNVRAREFMNSHVIHEGEGTFVFTDDIQPWFIAYKYAGDGHVANGWEEWHAPRRGAGKAFWIGLLMIAPGFIAAQYKVEGGAAAIVFLAAVLGFLLAFFGFVQVLGNMFSKDPEQHEVTAALDGTA